MHDNRDAAARFAVSEWVLRQLAWEHQLGVLRERARHADEALRLQPLSARFPNVERAYGKTRVA